MQALVPENSYKPTAVPICVNLLYSTRAWFMRIHTSI